MTLVPRKYLASSAIASALETIAHRLRARLDADTPPPTVIPSDARDLFPPALRATEAHKIAAARKHFAAIDVNYDVTTTFSNTLRQSRRLQSSPPI